MALRGAVGRLKCREAAKRISSSLQASRVIESSAAATGHHGNGRLPSVEPTMGSTHSSNRSESSMHDASSSSSSSSSNSSRSSSRRRREAWPTDSPAAVVDAFTASSMSVMPATAAAASLMPPSSHVWRMEAAAGQVPCSSPQWQQQQQSSVAVTAGEATRIRPSLPWHAAGADSWQQQARGAGASCLFDMRRRQRQNGMSAALLSSSAPPKVEQKEGAGGRASKESSGGVGRMSEDVLVEECDDAVEDLHEVRKRAGAARDAMKKGKGVMRATLMLMAAVLSSVSHFLLQIPPAIISIARMSRADWSSKLLEWRKVIVHELNHYWVGTKLLWADLRITSRLVLKMAGGQNLTRRERQQLTRTSADLFRLVPFAVFVIVPFMEFLLPFALRIFPNMLPSTFQDKMKEQEKLKKRLQARIQMARFLQDTVGEMAKEVKSSKSGEVKKTAEELQKFLSKVRTGSAVSNDEIIAFASLFNDELTLDNMSRPRLVSMCKYMGLQTFGTDAYLRYILRAKLAWIKEDDKMIQQEGIESLSEAELRAATRERGMLGLVGVEEMRQQLRDWLDLSLSRAIPSSLLILSRAFFVAGKTKVEDAVSATLSSLPNEVVASVSKAAPAEDATSSAQRKLDILREEEQLIKEEAEAEKRKEAHLKALEASRKERDLALEEMKEDLPAGASAAVQGIEEAEAAEQRKQEAAAGAAVEAVSAAQRDYDLCKLSAALAVLASSSSVAKERADFLRLVNKEIELYNGMVEAAGKKGDVSPQAFQAVREASEEVADTNEVSEALINKVDSMLHKLEKELDDVDAKIGSQLKVLDTDYDGKVTPEEVATAAAFLRDSLGQEPLEELVANLAKDKDGKILVEDIVKLGTKAEGDDGQFEEKVR